MNLYLILMKKKFVVIVGIFILAMTLSLQALADSDIRVVRMFSCDELDNLTYTAFCMDSSGFMWIGTDNGLFRCDGNHFSQYRHQEKDLASISDNRILGIIRDRDDRLWIATANGLNLYDVAKDSFIRIDVPDFGQKGYIISISSDELGKIYFVVAAVGIYELSVSENGEMEIKKLDSTGVTNSACSILAHKNGCLYAGTKDGIIYEYGYGKRWRKVAELKHAIFDMSQEGDGSIIINTFDGLNRLNPDSRKLTHIKFDSHILINNLSSSIGGYVYIATYGAGVWRVRMNSDEAEFCDFIYSPFIDMKDSRIGVIYGANDGSLWIGCDFFGVLMVPANENTFIYRKFSQLLKDFEVPLSAMDVWKGNTVIGNSVGRVAVISEDGKVLRETKVPGGNVITSIDVIDDDKALLGVMESGVWEIDLRTDRLTKIVDIPEKYLSVDLCQAKDGCIYIGLYGGGLLKFDRNSGEKKWLSPDSNGDNLVSPYFIAIKAYGNKLWIGSYGGLACYDISTGKFEDIDQTPYIACVVSAVFPESDETMLIGTSDGLIRYNTITKALEKFTTLDGLTDNDVKSIALDGKGGIWIGTMRGITYKAPGNEHFVTYNGGNGMVERTFERMIYSEDTDRIYAAGRMGMTSFFPDSISVPDFKSPLKISGIYLKGSKMNVSNASGFPEIINLAHNENSIALRISTMDFRDTSNTKYLWKFAGDTEWEVLPDGTDIIYLTSLNPGRHTIEYKAEEAGIESPVSIVKIDVAYPWYLTWQAKAIYVMLLISLVALVIIVIRKRQREKINEKKLQFFMDMSHDMRSPLTLILNPLESLLKQPLKKDIRDRIRGVYRNAHRILNTVNQLLDLKKIDYGKKHLECRKTSLPKFIGEIVEMFKPQASEKDIDITFAAKGEWDMDWIDRSVLDRIMVNLISNAIKYTPKNGSIDVMLEKWDDIRQGKFAKISVTDSGIGLDSNSSSVLFQRFYRSEKGISYSDDGFGIGLDICRRYISLHHGEIRGENRKDGHEGSVFKVLIPLGEQSYQPEDLIFEEKDAIHDKITKGPADSIEESDTSKRKRNLYSNSKVLLVEDDLELRESLFIYLKEFYKVFVASDGAEGFKLAQELRPDVVITDVKMQPEDGLQLLRKLKSNIETQHIPVVIMSHKSELADRVEGWQRGAESYISKPFDFNELKSIIYNLIDGRKKFEGKFSVEVGDYDSKHTSSLMSMKGNDEVLIERVNKILDTKLDEEDMNVDKLAEELGVSRTHLYRRLKERLGMNPSDYIRNKRLQRACELLKNDDLDITQIAYALGFSSQSQFSTTFKRFMGYTPTEFRTKHKKDIDSKQEFNS